MRARPNLRPDLARPRFLGTGKVGAAMFSRLPESPGCANRLPGATHAIPFWGIQDWRQCRADILPLACPNAPCIMNPELFH